jgi:hypothetical protein
MSCRASLAGSGNPSYSWKAGAEDGVVGGDDRGQRGGHGPVGEGGRGVGTVGVEVLTLRKGLYPEEVGADVVGSGGAAVWSDEGEGPGAGHVGQHLADASGDEGSGIEIHPGDGGLEGRRLCGVRPAWAHSYGCKSRHKQVTASEAKRNCMRATECGKEAWIEAAGRFSRVWQGWKGKPFPPMPIDCFR